MKQTLFTMGFLLIAAFGVQAQVVLRPQVGINASSLSTDLDSLDFGNNIGYQLGADLQFGGKFYVQPGLMFEFLKNEIDPRVGESEDFTRTYMRIPVMVGYNFGGNDKSFGFRVFTGPNASFALGAKGEDEDYIEKDDLKNAVFGWNAGLGIDFSIIFLDLGYQFGLSEVFEDFDEGTRNNLFYGNAGIRIRF
jgi:hypothetical protein